MIYLRLAGGLGNQLFQLGAAIKLSKVNGAEIRISTLGLSAYSEIRTVGLFQIIEVASHPCKIDLSSNSISLIADKIRIGRWIPIVGISDRNIISSSKGYIPNTLFLDGYFQDFWKKEEFLELIDGLKPLLKREKLKDVRIDQNDLLVHFRGGDFINHPDLSVVDFEWFKRSVRHALNKNEYVSHIKILSEDESSAFKLKDYLEGKICRPISVIHSETICSDFNLISSASLKIISNSTFAFWGHALGDGIAYSPPLVRKGVSRKWALKNEFFIQ